MYKLYTFGCSFTEDFENVISSYNNNSVQKNLENRPAQIKYIEDFLNGEVPESWSKILGKLLNFEVKNCAQGGSSNYDIFERVCENSKNYSIFDEVFKMGGKTIRQETNGKINDNHLGKTGHKVQAELFYEHILST